LTLTAPEHLTPTEAMPMARELAAPMEDAFSWASPSAMRGHALNADTSTSHE
jgi:hypothetical protein